MGTLIPSNGTYQVKALVNGNALENCSIIRANDKIRPYFAVPVANDPDLIGLLVYLQDSQGEVAGGEVRYILETYTDTPVQAEGPEEEGEEETEEEEAGESNEIALSEIALNEEPSESEEEESEKIEENGSGRRTQRKSSDYEAASVPPPVIDIPIEAEPVSAEIAEIAVRSLAWELPYFPLPENLEIGLYTLVFEALGKGEMLSRTEIEAFYVGNVEFSLKDISMYLPGLSGPQLIPPGTTVMLEARIDYDRSLDPYVIWYNGKSIISEGKISDGAVSILWQAPEQAGFYSVRMEVFPVRLKHNFTGLSREIALPVSPKALSLGYFFENDPQFTGRSPLAAGTVYPEQVRLITAMLAALEDENAEDEDTEEIEITLPQAPELLRWYQFEGNLDDLLAPLAARQTLVRSDEKEPRWAAGGQSYGLSIEPDDAYLLSPVKFIQKEQDQGGGVFLLHISPPAEGAIFSAFFPLQSSETEGAWIDMVKGENVITLRLSAGNAAVEMPLYLADSALHGLIPIVVEFYIRPYRMEAKISMGDAPPLQEQIGSIRLPGDLSGEGRIRLSGTIEKSRAESITKLHITTQAVEMPVIPEEDSDTPAADEAIVPEAPVSKAGRINTVWDELAILLSSVPLMEEEAIETVIVEEANVVTTVEVEESTETPASYSLTDDTTQEGEESLINN